MDARLYALQNAIRFDGKANPKAVMGQLMQKGLDPKEAVKLAEEAVKSVAGMSVDEMKKELQNAAPELLERRVKERPGLFDSYDVKDPISAFPPEPSKYPHIGHAKAIIINYEFAKQKKGKFYLRFEDTNPTLAKKEFYDIHLENYGWLGIKPDKVDYASDHMDDYYRIAERLLKEGNAYICSCEQETMRQNRGKGIACTCRDSEPDWKAFLQAKEGAAIVRAKIDIAHKNTAMRDPALMRIMEAPHVRTGTRYRVWPTYDLENAAMDGLQKITNRFRSKEFELRNELQRWLQRAMGFKETEIREFARFNLKGVESSGRIIREKIEKGELSGWDDPSLTTLVALRRRGFTPKAIWDFVLSTGITKAEATLTWDDLIKHNKRVLDKTADRYFFVKDPVKIEIENAPEMKISIRKNPEVDHGTREFKTTTGFLIAKDDFNSIKDGKLYRLMDCLNFQKEGKKFSFVSKDLADYRKEGESIIHWLPSTENTKATVRMPDNSITKGIMENIKLKPGTIIQFERFGFCRLDEGTDFWYAHN